MPRISLFGCGWLGLPLGKRLVEAGYGVRGSTTTETKLPQLRQAEIDAHLLTLSPETRLSDSPLSEGEIAIITLPPTKGDGKPGYYLRQMTNLASELAAHQFQRVLFISATSVYPQENREVTEEDARRIESPFTDTPWLDIEACFTQGRSYTATVVRFSGLIGGEYQPGRYFSGRPLGGADDPVNMIHREDCIGAIMAIIDQGAWGEVFNASACQHPSRRQIYTRSCQLAGLPLPLFSDEPKPYRLVNCDKLKKQLGYRFRYPDPLLALEAE
ncbi:hypothetical protein [Ferrimonas sp. YFM]|uniref:hypothetical protein n=1 Tax=Ferrimonas sp. YFM TaxID=3028878 RepID=UPI002572B608|nr:hypothetical protein [Ferrimonas sp. YFM]BDY03820.1 NAD(P)-dependent oxidoreductase [Ferrimonas sp. YFM]